MGITFTRHGYGDHGIFPRKSDGVPFTDAELVVLIQCLNELELPIGDPIPDDPFAHITQPFKHVKRAMSANEQNNNEIIKEST